MKDKELHPAGKKFALGWIFVCWGGFLRAGKPFMCEAALLRRWVT